MSDEVLSIFQASGALIQNSHLVYTSGRHGSDYVNKDALYPDPEIIAGLCERLAKKFAQDEVQVVLAPALGGIILTQWTAYALSKITGKKVLAVFAEKTDTPEGFILKRGYEKLITGKRTLILEDILTTGGSAKKVVALAERLGAKVLGVGALCNRGGIQATELGVKTLYALLEVNLQSWPPDECPLCKKGVAIQKGLGKG